jgi:hypothetical protein
MNDMEALKHNFYFRVIFKNRKKQNPEIAEQIKHPIENNFETIILNAFQTLISNQYPLLY